MTFEVGDTVVLKSGGPAMIVEDEIDVHVRCSWSDDNNIEHVKLFDPALLTQHDDIPYFG